MYCTISERFSPETVHQPPVGQDGFPKGKVWQCKDCDDRLWHGPATQRHYRLDWGSITSNESCPSCRLLASICKSYLKDTLNRIQWQETDLVTISYAREEFYQLREDSRLIKGCFTDYMDEGAPSEDDWAHYFLEVEFGFRPNINGHSLAQYGGAAVVFREGMDPSVDRLLPSPLCLYSREVRSQVSIDLVKHWMDTCQSQHERCKVKSLPIPVRQVTRFIDVCELKLVSPKAEGLEYVALSYVWGVAKPLAKKDNFQRCCSTGGLVLASIPKTISDAIRLVRDMGERYLWVDTLCIVQDDPDDKQRQLPAMGTIYRCAKLVIVAAAGEDAYTGLPGLYDTDRRVFKQCNEGSDQYRFASGQAPLSKVLMDTIWRRRGWTFQEAVLSHRTLFFTKNLIYWSCRTDIWREDIVLPSETHPVAMRLNYRNSIWGFANNIPQQDDAPKDGGASEIDLYYQQVSHFSTTKFRDYNDSLWAFTGILESLSPLFPRGFIWGTPYDDLDSALLWYEPCLLCVANRRSRGYHKVTLGEQTSYLPYPTWSWLSTANAIMFQERPDISEITWHDSITIGQKLPVSYLDSSSQDFSHDSVYDVEPPSTASPGLEFSQLTNDFGLLCFTAEVAELVLEFKEFLDTRCTAAHAGAGDDDSDRSEDEEISGSDEDEIFRNGELRHCVSCNISSKEGEQLGTIDFAPGEFGPAEKRLGSFILLSSNTHECSRFGKHKIRLNLMLVRWEKGIAYREGICSIEASIWEDAQVATESRKIILG